MDEAYRVGDVTVLPTHLDVPGVGTLVVNSYVLHAQQPMLIDTGLASDGPDFIAALSAAVDPADLRWIWLTHDDADHTGNIQPVMELAPQARLATHGIAAIRMTTWWPLPLDRVHAITLGDRLDVGDRTLRAIRPPTFDNPMSTGIVDESTGSLFSVDAFGAVLPSAVRDFGELAEEELVGGMTAWTALDSPWAHLVDRSRFAESLDEVRKLGSTSVFSSHLPAVRGRIEDLLKIVASVPDADPFVAPNAEQFAQIAAAMHTSR
jgi:glyoxylase-like metal-dependent hydrolase (beta-lactamase superfamily II)